ncbi:alpha/beta hydrolase [Myceligenerans halotolerans]
METERIHPELRKAYRRTPVAPVQRRWQLKLLRAIGRLIPASTIEGAHVSDRHDDAVRVRIYRPTEAASGAGLLWIHGGGLVIGSPRQDDRICAAFARGLGLVCVSVDYRLAPEHPFPAAADDCLAAWHWFQRNASDLGVDPARIAVAGASAGGGLATGLAQRLHDAGGEQPVAQLLCAPMLDDRTAARAELDALRHPAWDNRANRSGWTAYLGGPPGSDVPEYAVPARRVDLAGLPPAWIGIGGIDLFLDENLAYAERLREADVDCELALVPGAPHGFEAIAFDAPVTQSHLGRGLTWLQGRLET